MSPIEVSAKPRRENSFRLASRIFGRARGSPRRGRVMIAPSEDDWSTLSQGRDYSKQLTRLTSPDLFGKLVPTLAIPDPRPQFPSPRLWCRIQLRPETAQPLHHDSSRFEPVQFGSELFGVLGDHCQGPPQPPVRSSEFGYIGGIDPAVVPGQLVVGEDRTEIQI